MMDGSLELLKELEYLEPSLEIMSLKSNKEIYQCLNFCFYDFILTIICQTLFLLLKLMLKICLDIAYNKKRDLELNDRS